MKGWRTFEVNGDRDSQVPEKLKNVTDFLLSQGGQLAQDSEDDSTMAEERRGIEGGKVSEEEGKSKRGCQGGMDGGSYSSRTAEAWTRRAGLTISPNLMEFTRSKVLSASAFSWSFTNMLWTQRGGKETGRTGHEDRDTYFTSLVWIPPCFLSKDGGSPGEREQGRILRAPALEGVWLSYSKEDKVFVHGSMCVLGWFLDQPGPIPLSSWVPEGGGLLVCVCRQRKGKEKRRQREKRE